THDLQAFDNSLRGKQSVERIPVKRRQQPGCGGMIAAYGDHRGVAVAHNLTKRRNNLRRFRQFVEGRFPVNLIERNGAHSDVVGAVVKCITPAVRQFRRILEPPNESVRVDDRSHLESQSGPRPKSSGVHGSKTLSDTPTPLSNPRPRRLLISESFATSGGTSRATSLSP